MRLGRYLRSVRLVLNTLLFALPALGNITLLMYIVMYVFAMIGMTLFAGMLYSGNCAVSKHANFDEIYLSILSLYRFATGAAAWCLVTPLWLSMAEAPRVRRMN